MHELQAFEEQENADWDRKMHDLDAMDQEVAAIIADMVCSQE